MGTLKSRCVIVGGGDCSESILKNNIDSSSDYIICADSGYDYVLNAEIATDLIIGDFDSIKAVIKNEEKITLPVEKDITDTVAAYYEGVKCGFKTFVLFGGTGGRFEHTFANISLMAKATKDGFTFTIVDDKHIYRCIHNSSIKLDKKDNQQVSVFAYGGIAKGVTEKGFYYSLENYDLNCFEGCLGTSNHIVDDYGEITVVDGTLIIIETKM